MLVSLDPPRFDDIEGWRRFRDALLRRIETDPEARDAAPWLTVAQGIIDGPRE